MPPEWAPHAGCLIAWPVRKELWGAAFSRAKGEYAAVARAIARFEPVIMVCHPGDEEEVRTQCGGSVLVVPIPIDDSWMRDSGPVFVRDAQGRVAAVRFRFNSWGEKYLPYDNDARVSARVAEFLDMRSFQAPFVLEGGAFFVDGEGTLLTTEQCLLNPNRNPNMTKVQIEQGLREYLGIEKVVWLEAGSAWDSDTDGHIDGVAHFMSPGHVLLHAPQDPDDKDHAGAQENLRRLMSARDASGRAFEVSIIDVGSPAKVPYANLYLANGGVIVPTAGVPEDQIALAQIQAAFPEREVVGVPGTMLDYGGGGPHCITQQIPAGDPAQA